MTKTSTVYRVEHETDGCGPYRMAYIHTGLADAHLGSVEHPTPCMESFDYFWNIPEEALFGCPSREKLDQWFKGFKQVLAREGFVVRVYECPEDSVHVFPSGKQVYFNKETASRIDTQSLMAYSRYYQTN